MMRKLVCLLLTLALAAGLTPAGAEEEKVPIPNADAVEAVMLPAKGYDFDFTLRLHPEALSADLQDRVQGYAELLEALRFQGHVRWAETGEVFDMTVSIVPTAAGAGSIDIRIHGAEDLLFVNSNLLADRTIMLRNFSLLNFCAKMSEHLDLPLHLLALLYPYSWVSGLELPLQDWRGMVEKENEQGIIPEEAVRYLWDCWAYRVEFDEPTRILISALCKDSEMEEAFRGMVAEIPDYVVHQVAQDQEIQILRTENSETWRTASGDVFFSSAEDHTRAQALVLPRMKTGYLPVYLWDEVREKEHQSGRLRVQILGDGELLGDLVNLQASYISFPLTWPADCDSLLSLNLTGGLLPNVGVSAYLAGEKDGHVRVELRKPTVDMEPGALMLTLEGSLTPLAEDAKVRELMFEDATDALDLLVANDATIRAFLPDLVMPMVEGMVRFLVGVPTAACQTIMDDLTDLGVFEVLLGE